MSIEKYLDKIKPYLTDLINNNKTQGKWRIHSGNKIIEHKAQGEWKIQLIIEVRFISSKKYSDDTRTMHAKSNNIENIMDSETDQIVKENN